VAEDQIYLFARGTRYDPSNGPSAEPWTRILLHEPDRRNHEDGRVDSHRRFMPLPLLSTLAVAPERSHPSIYGQGIGEETLMPDVKAATFYVNCQNDGGLLFVAMSMLAGMEDFPELRRKPGRSDPLMESFPGKRFLPRIETPPV